MRSAEATGEIFWAAFKGLPPDGQRVVLARLVRDERLRRDLVDLAVIEERRGEPERPLREYLKAHHRRK